MKFSVALCTILTAGLCMIRASEVDELDHVEDQNALVEEDYFDSELNEVDELDLEDQDWEDDEDYFDSELSEVDELDLEDLNMEVDEANFSSDSRELRARPSNYPFCIRTHRSGWGGECLNADSSANFLWQTCDHIFPPVIIVDDHDLRLCYPNQYCCVNCHHPKQTSNCFEQNRGVPDGTEARRNCCRGELWITHTMDSECNCCFRCEPTWQCRKRDGFCVSKFDPVLNFTFCEELGYPLRRRWCTGGWNCACCAGPKPY
ncbi:unnamed protein product [Meganyctiphanes norvegica]|uniref:Uncharacterized protein n=1 Tax=Meganyctiphanes norvegica TaxID=48144 RepID=A0AAV2R334_MEGNR